MQPAIDSRSLLVGLAALSLALTGCASPDGYQILAQEQQKSDRLPDSFTEGMDLSDFELNSARLSAEHDGTRYYLILKDEAQGFGGACLAIAGPDPMIGCGGGGVVTVTPAGPPGTAAQLVPHLR